MLPACVSLPPPPFCVRLRVSDENLCPSTEWMHVVNTQINSKHNL